MLGGWLDSWIDDWLTANYSKSERNFCKTKESTGGDGSMTNSLEWFGERGRDLGDGTDGSVDGEGLSVAVRTARRMGKGLF